ncbi:Oidioi.mRNA.OKI2018_I69.chr1.g2603.t1.cds [Oikopleura dioica]|uniref:Oidioi.mRNA.OKI2018_I69.chr1.g2603.t1.cds n=1 Tax=Oikopleura dioica TaxID=34765 RepID=A0ABN7SWU3_OIKDI|nr:Oidioi.mRNA.OKI2018_I69.chr1.g2603.t1.cds [Oikopleura dioica]
MKTHTFLFYVLIANSLILAQKPKKAKKEVNERLLRKWAKAKAARQATGASTTATTMSDSSSTENNQTSTAAASTTATTTSTMTTRITTERAQTTIKPTTTERASTTSYQRVVRKSTAAAQTLNGIIMSRFNNPIAKYLQKHLRQTGTVTPQTTLSPPKTQILTAEYDGFPPVFLKSSSTPSFHSVDISSLDMSAYPPQKVLFSEKNSTNKFEIKLWDTIPFNTEREVPDDGLVCYACQNALTHEECNVNKIKCNTSQKASCMIEIRSGGPGQPDLISKGCKQVVACINNNKNPNSHNCCCEGRTNECNRNGTTCANSNLSPITLKNGRTVTPRFKSFASKTAAKWGPWLNWSGCSQLCGGGIRRRRRMGYGPGANFEEEVCNDTPCKDGEDPHDIMASLQNKVLNFLRSDAGGRNVRQWETWESWGPCGTKCGRAFRERTRTCPEEDACPGSDSQRVACTAIWGCNNNNRISKLKELQSQFSPWTSWLPCSKSCGIGTETRTRTCIAARCNGFLEQTRNCNSQPCQGPQVHLKTVAGEWSTWNAWSECSVSCNGGSHTRTRKCIGGECVGESTEELPCGEEPCARWSEWSSWTDCSKDCDGGFTKRERLCSGEGSCEGTDSCGSGGSSSRKRSCSSGEEDDCTGSFSETKNCNLGPCAHYSPWSVWSECDSLCGGGITKQARTCVGIGACEGPDIKEQSCNEDPCLGWASWSSWTSCSEPCGVEGTRDRQRECEGLPELCKGESSENESCFVGTCAEWSDWLDWGSCSSLCDGGKRERSRICTGIGECEGSATNTDDCNIERCAIWSEWSDYGPCSTTCGIGERVRERSCDGIGSCSGNDTQISDCSYGECADWSEWAAWTECSKSCGDGLKSRSRDCFGLGDCKGNNQDTEVCNMGRCAFWADWQEWGQCSQECDIGKRARIRSCDGIGECHGEASENENCNTGPCAYWDHWGSWSACSASCGDGLRQRKRDCLGVGECEGSTSDLEACDIGACADWAEWNTWGRCSASCGGGQRVRERNCIGLGECKTGDQRQQGICSIQSCEVYGLWAEWSACSASCSTPDTFATQSRLRPCLVEDKCLPQELLESQKCPGSPPCPTWSIWSDWSQCSETCGIGQRSKARECLYGDDCEGDIAESESCSDGDCPTWTDWLEWSACSETCGEGSRFRNRICQFGHEEDCDGNSVGSESCNVRECPIWSDWETWTKCSKSCGKGQKLRQRVCINGEAGEDCLGSGFEELECSTEKCPFWVDWMPWSECSSSCGTGIKARKRRCRGGRPEECGGNNDEEIPCNTRKCPEWTTWEEWNSCSASCGGGNRQRRRKCQFGADCEGSAMETEACNPDQCPYFEEWSEWTKCSASCGSGNRSRSRDCVGELCSGEKEQTEKCMETKCPSWSTWLDWSNCGASCGNSTQTRERNCLYSTSSKSCEGTSSESQDCIIAPCPYWAKWAEWTPCTVSCGGGRRRQSRGCMHGPGCEGGSSNAFKIELCNTDSCSNWSEWSEFDSCSASCGGGIQKRYRSCEGGDDCEGKSMETNSCNQVPCPKWSEYSDWSPCSSSCGEGIKSKKRSCENGDDCEGESTISADCNLGPCGQWSEYGSFGECSKSCGGGLKSKTRTCIGGDDCEGKSEITEKCNRNACPFWSDWSEPSPCSATCGGGESTRKRWCKNGLTKADCNGPSEEITNCGTNACPTWGDWSAPGECSVTCGGGFASQSRQCNGGIAGVDCIGELSNVVNCADIPCPTWSNWGDFGSCSSSCGGGMRSRSRTCENETSTGKCTTGEATEESDCNTSPCPRVGEWSDWSECSATCGGGEQNRARSCMFGSSCTGDKLETRKCNKNRCPEWSEWAGFGICSATCGGGKTFRSRSCQFGDTCPGKSSETVSCADDPCPSWSEWSDYSECSVSCGAGEQQRSRSCQNGYSCMGSANDSRECKRGPCPEWEAWTKFSACSKSCGGGISTRTRKCADGVEGVDCLGEAEEQVECNTEPCAEWTKWTEYSSCSVSCGGGIKTSTRKCSGGDSCEGRSERSLPCGSQDCPTWSSWTTYGECSVTCGKGEKSRGRTCKNGDDCPGPKIETAFCELAQCGPVYTEWACKSGKCKGLLSEKVECSESVCSRWDDWEAWSTCTATCGGGMHYRQRQCIGGGCQGMPMAYEPCNTDACDAGCAGPRDVLFVAHYTTYMGSTFGDISSFFENIISTINVEPSSSSIRFAFSFYNHAYVEFFAFDWLKSIDEYRWAFSSFPPATGNSNYIGKALKGATDTMTPAFEKGRRLDTVGTVVLLTNAVSNDEVDDMASQLKEKVDRVIVVGLGYAYGRDELTGIASIRSKKISIQQKNPPTSQGLKAGCEQECRSEYSGATCWCSKGILNEDGRSCLAGCIDADANTIRTPGETWEVEGMFGMTCTCLESGDTDCTFGAYDFYNYGGW